MSTAAMPIGSVREEALAILARLGVPDSAFARDGLAATSPITGELIGHVKIASRSETSAVIGRAAQAFNAWRTVPPEYEEVWWPPRQEDDGARGSRHLVFVTISTGIASKPNWPMVVASVPSMMPSAATTSA